jgi:hypothetical protein
LSAGTTADNGRPDKTRAEIWKENSKKKTEEFADHQDAIFKKNTAQKQQVACQKVNTGAVEANSIHHMSVSMKF